MKVKAGPRPSREERNPGRWVSIALGLSAPLPARLPANSFPMECAAAQTARNGGGTEVCSQVPSFRKEWVGARPGS